MDVNIKKLQKGYLIECYCVKFCKPYYINRSSLVFMCFRNSN